MCVGAPPVSGQAKSTGIRAAFDFDYTLYGPDRFQTVL